MAKHIVTGTPTQVAHPWKSVIRMFVAAAVGIGVGWLVRTLGVDLTALSQPIIDSLRRVPGRSPPASHSGF